MYYTQREVKPGAYIYVRHMEYLRSELGDEVHFFDVKDGWGPLCEILGVEVPDIAFPHMNDAAGIQQAFSRSIREGLFVWAGIIGGIVGMMSLLSLENVSLLSEPARLNSPTKAAPVLLNARSTFEPVLALLYVYSLDASRRSTASSNFARTLLRSSGFSHKIPTEASSPA